VLQNRRSNLVGSRTMQATAEPLGVLPPAAPRAGAELAAARERLDWALEDVAAQLRMRPLHLRALEAGRIDELPGNAYALGFLRTYAEALGLDPQEMVRRFKAEAAEVSHQTELEFPVPAPERGLPAGALALLGLVLVVLAYVGWYRLSGEGRLPTEAVMTVPARLAPLAEQAVRPVAQPAAPPVAVALEPNSPPSNDPPPAPMAVSPGSAVAAPVNPLPDMSQRAPEPDASQRASQPDANQRASQPDANQRASQPDANQRAMGPDAALRAMRPDAALRAMAPDAAPAEGQPRIFVRATADAWVQVRQRAGSVLLNRVLKAGETWPVPARPNLLLTVGNAGGTEVVVDGAPIPPLGGPGVVRRDLPLDPDSIKDGKLAASATTPVAAHR
jgi:cytoskeleton protein RodZ